MLEVRDLTVEAERGRRLLDGLSFEIEENEAVGLVGRSGAGKSTLVSLLAGRRSVGIVRTGGTIRLLGESLLDAPPAVRGRQGARLGVLWQDAESAFDPLHSIRSHIEEVRRVPGHGPSIAEFLAKVGLEETAGRAYPHQLSGGMLQRAQLAVVLAGEPELIIADEPTTALDPPHTTAVLEAIRAVRSEERRAMLFISHDLELVRRMTSRILILARGRIVEEGPGERLFAQPETDETRALVAAGALARA